MSHKIDIIWKL